MEINVTIVAPELVTAINALACALDKWSRGMTTSQAVPVAPAPVAGPATAPDPTPVTKEKKITHEDLRDAMQPLKREISLQLVAEFSGKTPEEKPKLSDVPAEKHAELLAEAKRLAQLPENVKQAIA